MGDRRESSQRKSNTFDDSHYCGTFAAAFKLVSVFCRFETAGSAAGSAAASETFSLSFLTAVLKLLLRRHARQR